MNKKFIGTLLLAMMMTVTGCGNGKTETTNTTVSAEENAQASETEETGKAVVEHSLGTRLWCIRCYGCTWIRRSGLTT